jgi:hypothetical protein
MIVSKGGTCIAGRCNWWEKCEKLEFYNDKVSYVEMPKKPPKPRGRPITETEEEYVDSLTIRKRMT